MLKHAIITLFLVALAAHKGAAIWCYRCTSSTPGCGETFNWRGIGYLGEHCPEDNDICVKVIERRGGKETFTRDCLSALSFRTDIPADKYEGCRPAAKDVRLAHYVNHTIKEHDVKRDFYNDIKFCFCFLDHRCNGAKALVGSNSVAFFTLFSLLLLITGKLLW